MSVNRRLGAVLRLSSVLFVIATLAWVASAAIATGPASSLRLLAARAGHTATAQGDGSLLIAGGAGNRGLVANVEFFDTVSGKATLGPALIEPRSGHSAIALADGRVLLAGGRNAGNQLMTSTEIYDPATGTLSPGAALRYARANHTTTLLADGRVLVAGGDAVGIAEIFDPAIGRFQSVGQLAVARAGHSAVQLGDGRVLLVGGHNAAGATAEIFDPATNTFSAVRGGLKTARVQPTLKLLSDGKVQVYGGDAEITMEIYNPAGYFSSRGHLLRDSSVFRSIMYSPGQAALVAIPAAHGRHYAEEALGPAGGEFERSGHTATEVAAKSTLVVVGGVGATGTALDTISEIGTCSGTVTTDLTDYYPGQTVVMSGSGWTPGEQITLNLHRDTNEPPDTVLTATADENGDWINSDYVVQQYDLNVTFVLTATGDSGCSAQTTFTDANTPPQVNFLTSGLPAGASVTVTYQRDPNGGPIEPIDPVTHCPVTTPPSSGLGSVTFVVPLTGSRNGNEPNSNFCYAYPATVTFGGNTYNLSWTSPTSPLSLPGAGGADTNVTGTYVPACTAPTASVAPGSVTITYGADATFTATLTGSGSITTQWQVDSGSGFSNIGSTETSTSLTRTLTLTKPQVSDSGKHYRLRVVNPCGGADIFSNSALLTVNKAQLTVTANNKSKTYGDLNPVFDATLTGVPGDPNPLATGAASCTTTATQFSAVGTYAITCAVGTLVSQNYTFTFVDGTLTINKATLTVTANNKSKTYGDLNPVFDATLTGVPSDPNPLATGAPLCTTAATQFSAAGNYPITCAVGTLVSQNYTFTFVAGTLTINKAQLTVTANNKSKTYGDLNPVLDATLTGVPGDPNPLATGAASCTTAAGQYSVVGTYAITCAVGTLVSQNYTFSFVAGTLTINKATLTVAANNKSKTYGDPNPVFDATLTGVPGDPNPLATGAASCTATGVTQYSAAGNYPITCAIGTLVSQNYTFMFVAGTLTINKAQLTVTAGNKSKVYGTPNPALTYVITGFVPGDPNPLVSGTASCSTAAPGSGVGTYPITCTVGSLTATNYTFTFVDGTLTITPALLTVTATNATKKFGDPIPVFAYTITGFVNGDTIAVVGGAPSCTTTATQWTPVSPPTYPITCTIGTLSAANYTFTFVGGTLTIIPRSALVNYIGQQIFVTSGSSSTTAQVTLSASVQDPTGLGLSGAKVDFIDCSTIPCGKTLASGVPVSPVQNALFTGTANTIVTLSTGQYGSQSYQILVRMTGNYDNTDQPLTDKSATVVVMQPPASYQTTGGGTFAGLSTAAGAYAGNGDDASFCVGLSYTSKLTNLKGQINLTIPQANGIVYVKSNSLSSMAITGTGNNQSATIYTKSSMVEVLNNGTTVTIDGNVTLRMDVTESIPGNPGTPGSVGFTVLSSKDSSLYYSNNWQSVPTSGQNVWKTVQESFDGMVTISN